MVDHHHLDISGPGMATGSKKPEMYSEEKGSQLLSCMVRFGLIPFGSVHQAG